MSDKSSASAASDSVTERVSRIDITTRRTYPAESLTQQESQVMTDLDGNVKIGELVCNVHVVTKRFSQVTGGLFWCDREETMPIQLLPLTNHLMYPWLYSESVEADVTKLRKDSAAIKFWKTIAVAKPRISIKLLLNVCLMIKLHDYMLNVYWSPLLDLPWTTNNIGELVILAFDHKRTEAMMKHYPPRIRRSSYPLTIKNTD